MPAKRIPLLSKRNKDLTGKKFSRLLVIGFLGHTGKHETVWDCVCTCGGRARVSIGKLNSGTVRSCGCFAREQARITQRKNFLKHGHAEGGAYTTEYNCWRQMKQRCKNTKYAGYKYYGGRGITVCKRWRGSFAAFLEDMGRKPGPEYSIERINNNGNYTPENCKWIPLCEQSRNRRPYSEWQKRKRANA